ncbi:MAG: EAL domain-containing protein, partial [Gammaproteobacteria bacterium]|nr:EAL domain-containing protein [Gammaproteobacteria bacterium]
LIETKEHNSQHALLYLDLDQFKIVNDTCGHLAGDKLLEELAAYLKKTVRDIDMLARLGGDEFALLLNLCPENMAINIANKILTTVSDFRFVWKEKSFSIGVSIGVVFINNPNESASNILRKADLACYMAKELGRNRIHVYTDEDQTLEERHGEMQWVSRIKHAIDNDLFFLVAQLIMPLDETKTSSKHYEILIRLNENQHIIYPDTFIPAAERYGLMPNIDRWVIEKAFSFMEKLLSSPIEENNNIVFSINLSGITLGNKDFFPFIKERLKHYNIPASSICFEITETAAISNLSIAMEFIDSIKKLGCSLALDDFGSGLCSFSYLKTIPVDYLKIDGLFVTRMLDNSLDMAIVVAIKQISLATQSKVIAEFVTCTEIKDKLRELGIDYAQGNDIAKPIPLHRLFKIVDINTINRSA